MLKRIPLKELAGKQIKITSFNCEDEVIIVTECGKYVVLTAIEDPYEGSSFYITEPAMKIDAFSLNTPVGTLMKIGVFTEDEFLKWDSERKVAQRSDEMAQAARDLARIKRFHPELF